jgi:hypothetical protein
MLARSSPVRALTVRADPPPGVDGVEPELARREASTGAVSGERGDGLLFLTALRQQPLLCMPRRAGAVTENFDHYNGTDDARTQTDTRHSTGCACRIPAGQTAYRLPNCRGSDLVGWLASDGPVRLRGNTAEAKTQEKCSRSQTDGRGSKGKTGKDQRRIRIGLAGTSESKASNQSCSSSEEGRGQNARGQGSCTGNDAEEDHWESEWSRGSGKASRGTRDPATRLGTIFALA